MSPRRFWSALAALAVFIVVPVGCNDSNPTKVKENQDAAFLDNVPIFPYQLNEIPDDQLWDVGYAVLDTTSYLTDDDGVLLLDIDGQLVYHPVQMANWGLALLDNYHTTGSAAYLRLAENHANRLIQQAVTIDGVYYYPYTFDFKLHGSTEPIDQLTAPWYSGMAEGRVIQLFVRLYKETGDEKYLDAANKTFPSFLKPRGTQQPWTVELDPLNFYWIEEYPHAVPSQVLNGFIYSLYGVYEYYMLTKDPIVLKVVQAALTTLREYAAQYRVPGDISYYCLAHRSQILVYHQRHIRLVRDLYRMTSDSYFKSLADALQRDHA